MNYSLFFLFSMTVMITISSSVILDMREGSVMMWDLQYINECRKELNLTHSDFTVEDLTSIGVPSTLREGCLMDCYYYKLGQIEKKNQTSFIEHRFIDLPPRSQSNLTSKSGTYEKNVIAAEIVCTDYLKGQRIEECNLVFQHRYCVSRVLNGTELPKKLK